MNSRNLNGFLNSSGRFRKDKHSQSLSRSNSQTSSFRQGNSPVSNFNARRDTRYNQEEEEDYYYETPAHRKLSKTASIHLSQHLHLKNNKLEAITKKPNTSKFESSRKQIRDFIVGLSRKVKVEIGNVTATIDFFNKNVKRSIDQQYQKIQVTIRNILEAAFRQTEASVVKLVREESKVVSLQILQVKQQLQKIHQKLRTYQEELQSPNWKKYLGDFLSTNMEQEIESLLQRSQRTRSDKKVFLRLSQSHQVAFINSLQKLLEVNVQFGGQQPKYRPDRIRAS